MKIFFSSWPGRSNQEALNRRGTRHRLLSYVELRNPGVLWKIESAGALAEAVDMKSPPEGLELMLDSGAFSAWDSGAVVTLEEYAAFVTKYSTFFDWIVNLDVIPGQPGRRPSPAEIDESAEIGWKHFYELKRALGSVEGAKLLQRRQSARGSSTSAKKPRRSCRMPGP